MATAFLHTPISRRSEVKETDMHTAGFMLEETEKGRLEGRVWHQLGPYTCSSPVFRLCLGRKEESGTSMWTLVPPRGYAKASLTTQAPLTHCIRGPVG